MAMGHGCGCYGCDAEVGSFGGADSDLSLHISDQALQSPALVHHDPRPEIRAVEPKRIGLSTEVLISVRQPSLSTVLVQLAERLCFHCISVFTVGSIEHEIVSGEIRGGPFLGLNRARFDGHFRPNRSDLFVQSWRDHLVGMLEHFCVNRVDVSLIVYEPVASFAALGATPFLVREPVCIEVQAYRGYESPRPPSVLPHR
jgi:hypothetical protein